MRHEGRELEGLREEEGEEEGQEGVPLGVVLEAVGRQHVVDAAVALVLVDQQALERPAHVGRVGHGLAGAGQRGDGHDVPPERDEVERDRQEDGHGGLRRRRQRRDELAEG